MDRAQVVRFEANQAEATPKPRGRPYVRGRTGIDPKALKDKDDETCSSDEHEHDLPQQPAAQREGSVYSTGERRPGEAIVASGQLQGIKVPCQHQHVNPTARRR